VYRYIDNGGDFLYKTMANRLNEIVDCRWVHLDMEFFSFSSEQILKLADYSARFIQDLFAQNCYIQWDWKDRRSTYETVINKINRHPADVKWIGFGCEADVLSNIVYSPKSFREYDKLLYSENSPLSWGNMYFSEDYPDILQKYLSDINRPEQCKDAILSLFFEKGKVMLDQWRGHDISMTFLGGKHFSNRDLYRGAFRLRIALECLEDLTGFSQKLIDYMQNVTYISPNINGQIAVSPTKGLRKESSHMYYFGATSIEYRRECLKQIGEDLCEYYHLPGAEWFNVISPLVSERLFRGDRENVKYENVIIDRLENGATVVKSTIPLNKIDVEDLLNVRRYLYLT